jgi:hypothetical protein
VRVSQSISRGTSRCGKISDHPNHEGEDAAHPR